MVKRAVFWDPKPAPPVGLLKVRWIDSGPSMSRSLLMGTVTVLLVWPSLNVTVPEVFW